jgi:hypothetical protein
LLAVAGCAARTTHDAPAAHGSSTVPTRPATTMPAALRPPAYASQVSLLGIDASAAWLGTRAGLAVSLDSGRSWSTVSLPTRVRPQSIAAVDVSPSGEIWLAVPDASGVDAYRRGPATGSWSVARLVPARPAGLTLGGQVPQATIRLGPGGVVAVLVGWRLTTSTAYQRIFVSTDDGATYQQWPAPGGLPVTAFAAWDGRHAVAVSGPTGAPHAVQRTADAGRIWTTSVVPVPPSEQPAQLLVGPPTIDGGAIRLPVIAGERDGAEHDYIETSTDGGANFTAAGPLLLGAADNPGEEFPALDGPIAWLLAGGAVSSSTDGGRTWTETPTDGAPSITSMSVIGPDSALAVSADRYLLRTFDAGHTWQVIGPA